MSESRANNVEDISRHNRASDGFVSPSSIGKENRDPVGGKSACLDLGNSLLHQFHRASQLANEIFVKELSDSKLTPRQYVVLAALAGNDGSSQTRIVNLTGIDRSTIADIIRRMVTSGLLARKRTKDDARAYSVTVTQHGREVLEIAEEVARKVDQTLLARLTPQSGDELRKALAALSEQTN